MSKSIEDRVKDLEHRVRGIYSVRLDERIINLEERISLFELTKRVKVLEKKAKREELNGS